MTNTPCRVILDIVPRRIQAPDWADAYDEVRNLLLAHPARLLGYDWTIVAGVPLPVFTRAIERDLDDPSARRWCVAGERATLATGECHTMDREIERYLTPATTALGPLPTLDDILFAVADDAPAAASEPEPLGRALPAHPVPGSGCAAHVGREGARPVQGLARVLGDATAEASYALPLLAAAMVVESRFPRYAMVHGEIDRAQAEAARRWAEGVLGRPIALPVRVDAWRLAERLGTHLAGQAQVRAVERLHLAPPETMTATLLGIFPRADIESWWLGKLRGHAHPAGAQAQQLLAAYLETTRDLARLCALACNDPRGPEFTPTALMEVLRARQVGPGPTTPAPGATAADASLAADLAALATLPSEGDLTPVQRAHVRALVEALRGHAEAHPAEGAAPLHLVATLLARTGPTLTEDAWAWIAGEQDAELLRFLTALAALDDARPEVGLVRRALFENRCLCRYALGVLLAAGGAP